MKTANNLTQKQPGSRRRRLKIDKLRLLAGLVATCLGANIAFANETQRQDAIIEAARQFTANLIAGQGLLNPIIEPGRLDPRLRLAACGVPLATSSNPVTPPIQNVSVRVSCDSPTPWSLYVPVRVTSETRVVMLVTSLGRGARISGRDVRVATQPTRASYVPMPSSASEVIGKELTRPVAAGTALSLAMVADPLLVKRGDKVTMVIERGGLKVTMAGKALEDGAVGDKISLSNLVSRRDVMGSVQADGTVRIL